MGPEASLGALPLRNGAVLVCDCHQHRQPLDGLSLQYPFNEHLPDVALGTEARRGPSEGAMTHDKLNPYLKGL